jgi:hypothetical protein
VTARDIAHVGALERLAPRRIGVSLQLARVAERMLQLVLDGRVARQQAELRAVEAVALQILDRVLERLPAVEHRHHLADRRRLRHVGLPFLGQVGRARPDACSGPRPGNVARSSGVPEVGLNAAEECHDHDR